MARRALALGALLVVACNPWDGEEALGLDHRTRTVRTNAQGLATLRLPPDSGVMFDKFLLALRPLTAQNTVYVDRIEDGRGRVIRDFRVDLERSEWRTQAVAAQRLNHLNWPIGLDDPPIDGDLRVVIGAIKPDRTYDGGVPIQVHGLFAEDWDFTAGPLTVNLIFAGDIADDPEMVQAFGRAADRMIEIYAPTGIEVDVEVRDWPDGSLTRPGFGAEAAWTSLTSATDNLAVDMVVVYDIMGADGDILGAAGSVPGGLLPSEKSGVILSALANAGPDLQFSEPELELLATTMAHELGHMLGLFHPVELTYDRWDALTDTDRCTSANGCQAALGGNLMYPTAICSLSSCLVQDQLTDQQTGVVHRYTGVH